MRTWRSAAAASHDEVAAVRGTGLGGKLPDQMLDLNRALDKLENMDARKAQLVELRFFLALTMDEAADVLGVSVATAERDLKFARSWPAPRIEPAPLTSIRLPAHAHGPGRPRGMSYWALEDRRIKQ